MISELGLVVIFFECTPNLFIFNVKSKKETYLDSVM